MNEVGLYKHGDWLEVDYHDYSGHFLRVKDIYYTLLNRKYELDNLKDLYNKDNIYIVKNSLQNYYGLGINTGYEMLCNEIYKYKTKLFNWLDNVSNPYYYIYYGAYEYNTYDCIYVLYHIEGTGITKENHKLARDYALYKLCLKS